ncbi:hypothetical protein [Rhodanobacter lindaniclasticus]
MNAPYSLPELKARQQAVYRAVDAATDRHFALRRNSPEYIEWALIGEACAREVRRLHRIWRRWYAPKEWAA